MASRYTPQVVAVIDTASSFGATVKQLKNNVTALQTQMSTLLADAPETLDTLNEIAAAIADDPAFFTTMASANTTLQNNIDALQAAAAAARTALQTALQTNIDGVATDLTTESTARGVAIAALDATIAALQADVDQNEADADTAIAAVQADVDANEADRKTYFKWDSNLTKVVNPLRSSEIEVGNNIHIDPAAGYATQFDGNVEFDNNTVLSHGGTDLTATFAEINAFDGRLDTLESDPTTAAAVAAVQADVDQNETDADAAIAAVQADVDQNEADADAADAALSARIATLEADPTTKTYVDTQITGVIDAAPAALDTLNELAAALGDDANYATTITNQIAAIQADVDQNETDADAAIAAVQADVDQNEADADAAIAAVQADVDQNEADADTAIALKANIASPTFTGTVGGITKSMVGLGNVDNTADTDKPVSTAQQTAIDAVQADVDQNESDADAAIAAVQADVDANEAASDAAEAALSGRLDTLEADPTTATALAAVQADVDQNEADADTAIALRAPLASPAFTGQHITHTAGDTLPTTHTIIGGFPDLILKTNQGDFATHQNEGRILWDDAGGGSHGAIKMKQSTGQTMDFFVGGVTASDKVMSIASDSVDVESLKIDGTAVTSTAAELNQLDGITLGTAAQSASGDFATAAQGAKADSALQSHQDISGKANLAGGTTFTGNVSVAKNWPDFELKSGDEKRLLFSDAGGNATAALKHVSGSLDFYVGGIAGGNKEMSLDTDGLDVTALKIDGTAITSTAAELNYCDGVTSNIQTQIDGISSFDNNNSTLTGTTVAANLDISGDIDVDGTTNLDNVDIDGNTSFDGTITVETTAGSTDYSEVALTNLSPSSFNQTYGRQSTGFVLDTGTVASGNALFHADSNYYYYVATTGSGANGRALIWSVEDNKWVTIFDMSGNFTEGNVSNNDALGSVFTDDVIATSQTQDGRSVPTASGDVTYTTSAASGLTNAADDSAAATAGVAVGQFYRNGSVVMIRVS